MTQQTNGTPELKYSKEGFIKLYEALKALMAGQEIENGKVVIRATPSSENILKAREALSLVEGK